MGEGIYLYGLRVREREGQYRRVADRDGHTSRRVQGLTRSEWNTELSILKGKTGSYQAKRNVITGHFTSRGNSHIANSIFEKRIPLKREDIPNLPNYLANASDEGASEADK